MSPKPVTAKETARRHAAYIKAGGNSMKAARALRMPRASLQAFLNTHPAPVQAGPVGRPVSERKVFAAAGKTRVVLMTSAQDDTMMYDRGFHNLEAYAAHRGAEIFVGGFTYQKGLFEDHMVDTGNFAQKLVPYIRPDVVQLAPKLVWYGRANILPTAASPLAGWDTNTRDSWAVFPHAKIALRSVPVMPGKMGKQIMTTGAITKPNYVQRNAGQKAEFHHTPGATIAEIKPDGTFFLRQIGIDKDGSFQDLNCFVTGNAVQKGPDVEACTWGDVHFEELDWDVARVLWGIERGASGGHSWAQPSMLNELRPAHQFFHDSFSFKARSHHTIHDPHERGILANLGGNNESVEKMLGDTAAFLKATQRDWSKSVHVPSNHNNHLHSWLKNHEAHYDVANAAVWHKLNLAWFEAIDAGQGEQFSAHAWALQHAGEDLSKVIFLHAGQSYPICQGTAPIECGLHGDKGPRGARGSRHNLAKIVERVNIMHSHEPGIDEAAYQGGTSSILNPRYAASSPGAWHHSQIVTYQNGKRTIVTLQNGAYRA